MAANRDEFHRRPTLPLHRWQGSSIIAGRDVQAGGTWLGVTASGRFAAVTNHRVPDAPAAPRSRGALTTDFLAGTETAQQYARKVYARRAEFGPFNLLVGTRDSLWYIGSHNGAAEPVAAGIHVLSNHLLDTPWPKVERIRKRLGQAGDAGCDTDRLLDLLFDTEPAGEGDLPDTGLPIETERLLSAPFVRSPEYGTRSSTALIMAERVRITERSHTSDGAVCGTIAWEFTAC